MTEKSSLLLYKVETPLHMSSGVELGVVDMPIQREKITGFPKLEASGIKGSIRRIFKRNNDGLTNAIFGLEEDGSEHASCIRFSDGKILLFPVKSNEGIFKWITCPFVIERFIKDYKLEVLLKSLFDKKDDCDILKHIKFYEEIEENYEKETILEDFKFKLKKVTDTNILPVLRFIMEIINESISQKFNEEIIILSDDNFRFFTEISTEINTRIKIGNNGIVENGALFTEEYLPMETILYGFISVGKVMLKEEDRRNIIGSESSEFEYVKKVISNNNYIQLGGNKSLGKGITQLIIK